MGHVNSLIASRLKASEPSAKMQQMAKQSALGGLTTFSGLFQVKELTETEKNQLEAILNTYALDHKSVIRDFSALAALTSEIKAINHQAALLHGERLKKVQHLLKNYKEGAFSAWLIAAYGNRQTPYNLMQYYDFYHSLPIDIRSRAEEMPRQALYTLASREGDLQRKIDFVTCYKGETKVELLIKIRDLFPLDRQDKRRENQGEALIRDLTRIHIRLKQKSIRLTKREKDALKELLSEISSSL